VSETKAGGFPKNMGSGAPGIIIVSDIIFHRTFLINFVKQLSQKSIKRDMYRKYSSACWHGINIDGLVGKHHRHKTVHQVTHAISSNPRNLSPQATPWCSQSSLKIFQENVTKVILALTKRVTQGSLVSQLTEKT